MTVDALQYAPDKKVALEEMARAVRPGGRLGFVAFELDPDRIAGLPLWDDPVTDYRPLLEEAGFEVLRYDRLPGWRDQVTAGFEAVLAAQATLEAELGEAAARALVLEASITVQLEPYSGHVLAVAGRV
jgi:SAM-dependent methyltransferase